MQQQTIQPRHSGLFVSLTGLGVLCSLHWEEEGGGWGVFTNQRAYCLQGIRQGVSLCLDFLLSGNNIGDD